MSAPYAPKSLDVGLYGTPIAELTRGRSAHRLTWTWAPEAAARWGIGSRVVSHGVPIGAAGERLSDLRAGVFLDGLLPEGTARMHYAVEAAIEPEDTFALVARYGRDTAGALVFTPAGERPPTACESTPLSDEEVGDLLREADGGARPGELTSTSLAGLVPKIALDRAPDGSWLRPAYGAPSTWILKVAHPEASEAADVDTEVACLDLGRRVGVTSVDAQLVTPGGVRAIAVSRYDRPRTGDPAAPVDRLHQEDLAQALGLATGEPTRKFQRGRTLPSWRAAAQVLATGGGRLSPLARLVAFSYLVGNTDHHAKNTSFLRYADGRVEPAPGYDIAAHLHHPGRRSTSPASPTSPG